MSVVDILTEVWEERDRQDVKWGEQNHELRHKHAVITGIVDSTTAKIICENAVGYDQVSWTNILVEEVAEFVDDAFDPVRAREELIQVAAVAVAAIESIDRNAKKSEI